MRRTVALLSLSALLAACGEQATLSVDAGTGPDPVLPAPVETALPTVKVARGVGWPEGEGPVAASGLKVEAFARGLDHPRWLHPLPNGDVLVAETDAPEQPGGGVMGWVAKQVMRWSGSSRGSADRVTLLRDVDGDGRADERHVLLTGLRSPFGMAYADGRLYVAATDALVSVPFAPGATRVAAAPTVLARLPANAPNSHWTKSLIASRDGRTLYVGVGSNSNVAENGLAAEAGRAAIWAIDAATGRTTLHATGLRNPVGLAWEPVSGKLWTAVNERDALGSDLVPDYMTSVRPGGFYGWPWSYYGDRVDTRVQPARPDMVTRAIRPDYALGPHTASLGLAFAEGARLGSRFAQGAFVGQRGSWNRNPPSGYRVIFVPFEGGRPAGKPVEVLTGFLRDGKAHGRPVGVAVDARGALLVADDVGDTVWRVTAAP